MPECFSNSHKRINTNKFIFVNTVNTINDDCSDRGNDVPFGQEKR